MIWQYIDGTVVHLGGKVEGDSLFARLARDTFERAGTEDGPLHCSVGEDVPLDTHNPHHVDVWLSDTARCLGVLAIATPDVPHADEPAVDTAGRPILL